MSSALCFPRPVAADGLLQKVATELPIEVDIIAKEIWALSPKVDDPESYLKLVGLTKQLLVAYEHQGRLNKNPLVSAKERVLSLPFEMIAKELRDSTCLVTGGLGCVGSVLVKELLEFNVKAIIILDIAEMKAPSASEKITSIHCDIRNLDDVCRIFSQYRPDFVFHTAAQRDPGYAETHVAETVSTNVTGTLNILRACEGVTSVRQMVFASTGKASRYFTEDVYAASKKIAEFMVEVYARKSEIKYSIVRFTHLLDNSLMNRTLKQSSKDAAFLSVHSPGKYVTAQNASEAAFLMLNALVHAESKKCNLLLVRYLDWPVESLAVALYYIKQSEREIPVVFVGNPVGYSEKFFRGQLDWANPGELNLLANVYENKYRRLNSGDDIVIAYPCSTSKQLLATVTAKLAIAKSEPESKKELIDGLKELVRESLKTSDKECTVNILRWGLNPDFLEMEDVHVADFNVLISLLVESLAGSEYEMKTEDHNYQTV